jgi:hypothetical protein
VKVVLRLTDAKRLFFELRKHDRIDVVEEHVINDHPEREYTLEEVILLIKGSGNLQDTTDPNFKGERFYWRTKDLAENKVRMVIEFEEDDEGQLILVISAGERR